MDTFLQQVINGLTAGSVYAVIALGYTMVYGIIQLINFAHGEVVMIGAMVAFTVINALAPFGLPALAVVLIGRSILRRRRWIAFYAAVLGLVAWWFSTLDASAVTLWGLGLSQIVVGMQGRLVPLYAGIEGLSETHDQVQYGGPMLCDGWRFPTDDGRASAAWTMEALVLSA